MNNLLIKRLVIAFALAGTAAACTVTEGRQTAGEYATDAAITTRVKAAMVKEPTLSAVQVGVETMDGTVQLSGFVDAPAKKTKAGDVARVVDGVKAVKNDLVVKP